MDIGWYLKSSLEPFQSLHIPQESLCKQDLNHRNHEHEQLDLVIAQHILSDQTVLPCKWWDMPILQALTI